MDSILGVIRIVFEVIGVFAMGATMTPNSSSNPVIDVLMRIINALGMNFGKAQNKEN